MLMDMSKLKPLSAERLQELELLREFRARFGFVPKQYLGDVGSPGRYQERLRAALVTGDTTGLHPLGRRPDGLKVD